MHFKRRTGIYMIEVYLPCVFLVVISFCSFFINREVTNIRILIGPMTILSMIILTIQNRLYDKQITYLVAIDYFVIICFIFIFASIIEYIFVHENTKLAYGDIGTFSNWIPFDRFAKLVYSSLQPNEQILKRNQLSDSLNSTKDDQLVAVVRLNSEPMIYDLPYTITDNNNNLLLNQQTALINQSSFNSLSLKRPMATNLMSDFNANHSINSSSSNFSTFPRTNNNNSINNFLISNQIDTSTNHLNDSLIDSLINPLRTTNLTTGKTLRRKLASIPEETIYSSNCPLQIDSKSQLNDSLKLLRQQQEQQLDEQKDYRLRNETTEMDMQTDDEYISESNDELKAKIRKRRKNELNKSECSNSWCNRMKLRINDKLNAKLQNDGNVFSRLWFECLSAMMSRDARNDRKNNNLEIDSIDQLNSTSKIDAISRLLFPALYLLFMISYYLIFVI